MFLRIAKVLALIAAVQILGGHWVALQSAAWAGMLVSFVHGDSLAGALEKTFDGEHPCALCKVVQKGESQEKKQRGAEVTLKMEAVLAPVFRLPLPWAVELNYSVASFSAPVRATAPPTPPPLAA